MKTSPTPQNETGSNLSDILAQGLEAEFTELADEQPEDGDIEESGDEGADEDQDSYSLFDDDDADEDVDDDDQGEDDDPAESGVDSDSLHTVKVDGVESKVTYDELRAGYSRQAHFTREMQNLAEDRKSFETERAAVTQERQVYAQLLDRLKTAEELALKEFLPSDAEIAEMREYDVSGYLKLQDKIKQFKDNMTMIDRERQRVNGETAAEQERRMNMVLQQERNSLLSVVPEWGDEKVREKEASEIVKYAKTIGFTDEDLSNAYDHKVWVVLRDAARFRKIIERRGQIKPKVGKKATGGAPVGKATRQEGANKALNNLKKNPNSKGSLQQFFLASGMADVPSRKSRR